MLFTYVLDMSSEAKEGVYIIFLREVMCLEKGAIPIYPEDGMAFYKGKGEAMPEFTRPSAMWESRIELKKFPRTRDEILEIYEKIEAKTAKLLKKNPDLKNRCSFDGIFYNLRFSISPSGYLHKDHVEFLNRMRQITNPHPRFLRL